MRGTLGIGIGTNFCLFLTVVWALPVVAVALRLVLAWAARAFFDIYSAVGADIGGSLDFVLVTGTAALSMMAPVGKLGGATDEVDEGRESLFVTIAVDSTEEGEAGLVTVLLGSKISSTGPDDLFLNWTQRVFPLLASVVPRMLEVEDDTDESEEDNDRVSLFI
eukprot:scaffold33394_cov62-Attheya_sp.AAC.3